MHLPTSTRQFIFPQLQRNSSAAASFFHIIVVATFLPYLTSLLGNLCGASPHSLIHFSFEFHLIVAAFDDELFVWICRDSFHLMILNPVAESPSPPSPRTAPQAQLPAWGVCTLSVPCNLASLCRDTVAILGYLLKPFTFQLSCNSIYQSSGKCQSRQRRQASQGSQGSQSCLLMAAKRQQRSQQNNGAFNPPSLPRPDQWIISTNLFQCR